MDKFRKQIVLFLVLAMSANVVLASQMSVFMMADYTVVETDSTSPCHGVSEESAPLTTEQLACCEAGCGACFTSSTIFAGSILSLAPIHTSSMVRLVNSLLEAHNANLYRPPILI